MDEQLAEPGPASRKIRASLRNTASPTTFHAGYTRNVVPSSAEAWVPLDALRFGVGVLDHFLRTLR